VTSRVQPPGASPDASASGSLAAAAPPSTAASPVCTPSGSDWARCEGQTVRLSGKRAGLVAQHPMIVPPGSGQLQEYVDVKDGPQVIVLVPAPIACTNELTVTGTLRGVRNGGAPGTKDSYEGWAIDGARVACR
jgi:hypothetical protein